MSDQFTRISCGGSPLPRDAPVVGLLFGESKDALQVRDADDIPTEITEGTKVQVDLHQAVFPQHTVVGWYRVSATDENPIPSDVEITQRLKQHYAASSAFCFCLLQVSNEDKKLPSKNHNNESSTMQEELPINIYELKGEEGLVVAKWQLETSDPERIAVERVMKEKPPSRDEDHRFHVPGVVRYSSDCW